jgi:glycosyltransferase involved in cell wall biosynthesis
MLRRLAQEADVLVHPSRVECFPMILAEAMAVGVPLVAGARSGGVPWVLDGGRAGVLTRIDSPGEFAASMCDLALDRDRRALLAHTARERVAANFQLQDVARAYVEWFSTGV